MRLRAEKAWRCVQGRENNILSACKSHMMTRDNSAVEARTSDQRDKTSGWNAREECVVILEDTDYEKPRYKGVQGLDGSLYVTTSVAQSARPELTRPYADASAH